MKYRLTEAGVKIKLKLSDREGKRYWEDRPQEPKTKHMDAPRGKKRATLIRKVKSAKGVTPMKSVIGKYVPAKKK